MNLRDCVQASVCLIFNIHTCMFNEIFMKTRKCPCWRAVPMNSEKGTSLS